MAESNNKPATQPLHVLGIAGSLRERSYNRMLLRAALELAPEEMKIQIFDRLGEIPLYNADVDAKEDPEPVTALKQAIRDADALLIATPEYNYSVPGVLQNAIDWASRPGGDSVLKGKSAAIMGASGGLGGTIRAQLHLRQVFLSTATYVVLKPEVTVRSVRDKFDAEGRLTDDMTRDFVRKLLDALVPWAHGFRGEK